MVWATAQYFLNLSHNTTNCIVTGEAGRRRRGSHGQARTRPLHGRACLWYDRDRATTRRGRATTRPGARGWELGRDTKIVSWLRRGDLMSRYSAARGCDTTLGTATRTAGACVAIQILYRERGRRQRGCDMVVCRDTMRDTTSQAYNMAGQACDTAGHKPTTRS